tara:strand:- start:7749 stop:8762 length:1014 start_codon:yes stop_codon:yes gene_type:complete
MISIETRTHRSRKLIMLLMALFTVSSLYAEQPGQPAFVLPHRMLLVASEGLYVMERDGNCSWSYNVPPMNGIGAGVFDDLVYDGRALSDGHFLFATHRYLREIDRQGKTVWEYRVKGTSKVKSFVLRPERSVAVLNSGEQAILELERGTGRLLKKIPLPAKGSDHTRYNLLRLTPADTYLVALRAENRFVEIDRDGDILKSYSVPSLPVEAQRLLDGSTLCSGQFGIMRFDAAGKITWSLNAKDVLHDFPMLLPCGFVPLDKGSILVVNSDWHVKEPGSNRVPLFIVDEAKHIEWTLDVKIFEPWKKSEIDPHSMLKEHRCMVVQSLPELNQSENKE